MANHAMPEHGAELYQRVIAKFADYPQVTLVKGLIPQTFETAAPDRIAYLHIDLNQAPAEIASLEHLFDRMVPGGILILDDYEWSGIYRPQKLAEDEWFDARRYRVMPLPTGQGLVITALTPLSGPATGWPRSRCPPVRARSRSFGTTRRRRRY